jgi:hypothetical protein
VSRIAQRSNSRYRDPLKSTSQPYLRLIRVPAELYIPDVSCTPVTPAMRELLEALTTWPDVDTDQLRRRPEWEQARAWGWIMDTGELTGTGFAQVHELPGEGSSLSRRFRCAKFWCNSCNLKYPTRLSALGVGSAGWPPSKQEESDADIYGRPHAGGRRIGG